MTTQFTSVGAIPTIYDGYVSSRPVLARMGKLTDICIHAWPSQKVKDAFKDLRAANPDIKITLGVGVDSMARSAVLSNSVKLAVSEFERIVRTAMEYAGGIQAVMWNAEASWKTPPNSAQRRILNSLVKEVLLSVADKFPSLPQLHTAYDHPTYHSTYNWEAWLGKDSPICMSLPQVYAAPGAGLMARRGDLDRRESKALLSWKAAVKAGWIKKDAPEGEEGDLSDVDWAPYYQLHSVPVSDTLHHMTSSNVCYGWALPNRADKDGIAAITCAVILKRRGFWGEKAVADWQKAHGLSVDNVAGWGQTIPSILAAV